MFRFPKIARARRTETRQLKLERLEDKSVPSASIYAVAPGPGGGPLVRVFQSNGVERGTIMAYDPGFRGGVHVASGDVSGDGVADIVTGAGAGGGSHVRVFDGNTLAPIAEFLAYDQGFRGGVNVAVGNLDDDPEFEIVTGAGIGGGPHVRVFDLSNATLTVKRNINAYDPGFRGGVQVQVGNIDGIPGDEIVTSPGAGGGPHVRIFSSGGSPRSEYFPYDPAFRGGVNIAVGDINGDGYDEVVTGPGDGGAPHVRILAGRTGAPLSEFFAYDPSFRGGVSVAVADANNDGAPDVITGAGPNGGPHLRAFSGGTGTELFGSLVFDPAFRGGLNVTGRVSQSLIRIEGHFDNPQPASAVYSHGSSSIVWGEPAEGDPHSGRSGLYFFHKSYNANNIPNTYIPLGTLSYLNGTIRAGTQLDTVDLVVSIQLDGSPNSVATLNIPMTITTTENTSNPEESADTVTLLSRSASRTITLPTGERKTIEFSGFVIRLDTPAAPAFQSSLTVLEGDFQSVQLVGQIRSLPKGRHFGIRLMSQDSIGIGPIQASHIEFELRDYDNGSVAAYTFIGTGATPPGLPSFTYSTSGSFVAFTTTRGLDITEFVGNAQLDSLTYLPNQSLDRFSMYGSGESYGAIPSLILDSGVTYGISLPSVSTVFGAMFLRAVRT